MSCFDEKTARALVRGTLAPTEAQRLRRHAEGCRACAALLGKVTPPGAAARRTTQRMDALPSTGPGELDATGEQPTEPVRAGRRVEKHETTDTDLTHPGGGRALGDADSATPTTTDLVAAVAEPTEARTTASSPAATKSTGGTSAARTLTEMEVGPSAVANGAASTRASTDATLRPGATATSLSPSGNPANSAASTKPLVEASAHSSVAATPASKSAPRREGAEVRDAHVAAPASKPAPRRESTEASDAHAGKSSPRREGAETNDAHAAAPSSRSAPRREGAEPSDAHAAVPVGTLAPRRKGAEASDAHTAVPSSKPAPRREGTEVSDAHAAVPASKPAPRREGTEVSDAHAGKSAPRREGAEVSDAHVAAPASKPAPRREGAEVSDAHAAAHASKPAPRREGAPDAQVAAPTSRGDEPFVLPASRAGRPTAQVQPGGAVSVGVPISAMPAFTEELARPEGTLVVPPPAPPLGASLRVQPPTPMQAGASPARGGASPGEPGPRSQVGRYHILDKLGSGGMGVVYSAYDPELHRRVAIKLLHSEANTVARADGASRLLREAQAMARLSHPNVVSVYDAGTFAGRVFIAMELVEGLSLRHWLRAEHRSWRDILEVFRQAGRGLAAAHAAGLVHRDFKPANVLVSRDGRAQVTDFGLARTTADQEAAEAGRRTAPPGRNFEEDLLESALTEAGLVMGTPAYMPPEQHEDGRTDARGDQFSYCASLYEALYGQLPFEGKHASAYLSESLAGRVRQPPRGNRVPTWLLRAVTRGLSPAPAERYPSMEALLAELGKDPTVAWRRRGIMASGVLVLYASMGIAWWMGNRRQAPCLGAEARLTNVWDGARKEKVRQAFTATQKPQAAELFTRVEKVLDTFALDWAVMHREACEATRVDGHQSDEVLSLRMGCLDRRRSALDAVAGVLAQTDAESLSTSLDAAQRLPAVLDCANVDALRRGLPESTEQRQHVEALRAQVDRATALVDAGRYDRAAVELKATLEKARALNYPPVLAEALELEGRLGLVLGDEARAQTALRESMLVAQATRHDELAARAAARLVTTVSQTPVLEEWALLQARSNIERAGGAPELEALLQTSIARNAFLRGQYPQAAEAFGRSAKLREQAHGPEHMLTLESLRNQAAALSRTPEAERTAAVLQYVLETTERVMGPDHPQTGMAANAVGYHLTLSRRFEEALPYLRRAIVVEERVMGEDSATLSYPLNNLAAALESLGRDPEARRLRERALALDLKTYGPSHPETASDLSLLAELALREGRARDALDLARRSVEAYESFQKGHPDQAASLTVLGQAQFALGRPREARPLLERALALRTAHPGPGEGLATTRFALARALAPADKARARTLAQQALSFYDAEPAAWSTEAQHVRAWMRGRPPAPP
ncbi:tetratricopeptide repeat protein [Myxococcus sp. K15C18031901]|uniref:protein kinase domain-containing protein n=1 Tax=Myxococcus dinghuensis TaxID=2906761 RepID=UPI0020A6EC6C|nr:tetratricopeptide repeat protein [Myxococcus dinghuensis]MCP3101903.1 tetratricopeptide repeat protein [Myxococcus dinghuensis]